jgi:glycosyltransferase involved in cell wall biosynthesis
MKSLSKGITVILCCYNHGDYVAKQLTQIVAQLDEIYAVVLLDDGSSDHSYDVMSQYAKCSKKIHLLRNKKNEGLILATNRACRFIKSQHVYLASADDQIMPGFFRDFNRAINIYPDSGFYFGDIAKASPTGHIISRVKLLNFNRVTFLSPDDFSYEISKGFRNAPGQTVVFDTLEFKRNGFYSVGMGGWVDLYPQYILGFSKGAVYLPGIYSIARIADDSWGKIQSKNVKFLRASGIAFTKKMVNEIQLTPLIRKSGILAYALGGYKTLLETKNLNKMISLNKIFLMMLREIWYSLPEKIRVAIAYIIIKK